MTTQPFPVSGLIYGVDRSVIEGAAVKITNLRNGSMQTQITNSSGEFTFTLTDQNDNDLILLQSWKAGIVFVLDMAKFAVSGDSKEINLYLEPAVDLRAITKDIKEMELECYHNAYNAKKTVLVDTLPDDISKLNGSYTLTYDGSNNLTSVDFITNNRTFRKVLSYDGSNNLTNASKWSVV